MHLIAEGADVNAENNKGMTALIYASAQGQQKVAEQLIRAGAQ